MNVKVKGGYRVLSSKGKNLGGPYLTRRWPKPRSVSFRLNSSSIAKDDCNYPRDREGVSSYPRLVSHRGSVCGCDSR